MCKKLLQFKGIKISINTEHSNFNYILVDNMSDLRKSKLAQFL